MLTAVLLVQSEYNGEKKPGERSDLAHKAYMGMRQMLLYNEILPGQKIKYQDMADRLGVSITPVIHALKWLEFKNIVRYEHNKGYYVNEADPQEIKEIYETRIVLEVAILPQTLANLNDIGIQRLQAALDGFEKRLKEELFDLLFLRYSRNLVITSISETSLREHHQIMNSLVARDLPRMQQTLSSHLENVKNHIIFNLDRMTVKKKESVFDFHSL